MKKLLALTLVLIALTCCAPPEAPLAPAAESTDVSQANLPNPAAVYCEQQGYRLEIRTAADGSQSGVCIFPDGGECDEWAFYRGECAPSDLNPQSTETSVNDWQTYRDEEMGFSFLYPSEAAIELGDNGYTVFVNGPVVDNNAWPVLMISYPNDRAEYLVPEGTDLRQWLVDHNLYLEQPQADRAIAGTTAIHTRFPGGGQSFAHDRFFLVHDRQMFVITILHAGGKEDWDLYDRFLESFQFEESTAEDASPSGVPTAQPIDPNDYEGWWTYTHSDYGFSIMLPEDWEVEEVTTFDPLMSGHTLNLHPKELAPEGAVVQPNIGMAFRRIGEDALLWPTGVGEGQFILQGNLDIAGLPAQRLLLVCPGGEVTSIWYQQAEGQPNIARGDLEFGFIFSAGLHCESGQSLGGKTQLAGEMIIASLRVP